MNHRSHEHVRRTTAYWMQGVALGVLALVTTGPALAQSVTTVETVVVTAERRATDLQTTAIAAKVLSGEDLKVRNINTVDSLAFATPSLTVQSSGENSLINIRGIGKSDGGAQDSSGVLIYRDGVSTTPNGFISDEPYYDISSIEVLRGPQGTFAGQNATGGAIFINETGASLDAGYSGYGELQYGSYNDVRLRAAMNIPLTDDFAIRIATDEENRDTFFKMSGPYTGNPGNLHTTNARVSALWQPTDAFKAEFKVDYNYIDHGGSPAGPFNGSTKNIFNVASDAHLQGVEQQVRGVLHLDYKFDNGITLKSISGYQYGRLSYDLDADGTANPALAEIFDAVAKDQTISEEVNLVSPDSGPLTWVVGGVYQDDVLNVPTFVLSLAPGGTTTTGLAISSVQDKAIRQSWGIFAQASYQITDALKLQVGARYSETSFKLDALAYALFFGAPIQAQAVNGEIQRDSRLTGKVDLDYNLDENNFLYAFVATGHKGGGINGDGTVFQAENVTDYELGWKGKFFDGHVLTQLGGFYDEYKNFQLPLFVPTAGGGAGAGETYNATGVTNLKGIEAQIQAVFGGFSLDMGGSYLDTALGDFIGIDSRDPTHTPQDLTGRMLPNAPHWTAQFGVQYAFDLGEDQTLTPRLDYGLAGSRWANAFEVSPGDRLMAQNIVNAQITYDAVDHWEITAYGTNIFDLHYATLQLLGNLAMPGAPAQFGIRVAKSF
ncbi:MAG: TonB-dependent receptor [Rhizomicrobium sp.]